MKTRHVTHDLFTEKVLSFQLARSFHIHDREGKKLLGASESLKKGQVSNYKDVEEQGLSHSMWKDRTS